MSRMWDDAAAEVFFDELKKKRGHGSSQLALRRTIQLYEQEQLIGSSIYTKMYKACRYSSREKIELVLNQLGAALENGTLQLTGAYRFDPQMPPHAEFLALWAHTVQTAFKGKVLDDPRVHQLRMYIDRNNIQYIRRNFGHGQTDEAALAAYVRTAKKQGGLGGRKLIAERARFHNKFLKTEAYQSGQENRKRLTPNFHSEFILDAKQRFVSQWNVLVFDQNRKLITERSYYDKLYPTKQEQYYFEQQIMDGESFNYANRNNLEHRRLDSMPPRKEDYTMRKEIGKKWSNPMDQIDYRFKKADKKKDDYSKKDSHHKSLLVKVLSVVAIGYFTKKIRDRKK
ncbi:hypothetical protein NRIC_35330 [Enterococcus florum]|uniref:DUF3114 domain-containing protein n=1 Tax=Enterococcus florum TaxID=2480627 RepID=A0A4P5PJ78_9ENTE|nr:DUF3114 domain-containing protein [Enterococcus florum]GCF95642.1 hypothetical protein NRIC_35330 [Enterococcus florum]